MIPSAPPTDLETALARHGGFVRAVARRLVRDEGDADDVAQETCLAALRFRPAPGPGLGGWLARVARNFAFRRRREEIRRERREALVARPETHGALSPADLLQRQQAIRAVMDAVMGLAEPYRSAVVLRYYEDLEPAAIAERLGVPAATVRTRLHRGLEQVRRRLDAEYGGDRASWTAAILPVALAGQGWTLAAGAGAGAGAGAAAATSATAAGAGWTSIAFGGLVMAKKILAAGALVAAIAVSVVVYQGRQDPGPAPAPGPGIGTVASPEPAPPAGGPSTVAADPRPAAIAQAPFKDRERPAGGETAGAAALPEVARLAGRVVDEQGTPLPDIPVTLELARVSRKDGELIADSEHDSGRSTATGADGRFSFAGIPVGVEAAVRARPAALCDAFRKAAVAKPGPCELGDLVATAGGAVEGRVRDPDGRPVAGARVAAMPVATEARQGPATFYLGGRLTEVREETTAPDGGFRIQGLAPGTWQVDASAEGWARTSRDGITVRRLETTPAVDLVLAAGTRIAGTVRDAAGAPVADARVSAAPSEFAIDTLQPLVERVVTVRSQADGTFTLEGLDAPSYNVSASKPGFASRTVTQARPGAEVAFELPACAVVHGEVRSLEDRMPVAEFEITAGRAGPGRRALGRVLRGAEAAEYLGVPEAAGLFAVVDLQDGDVVLRARAPGFADRELEPFAVAGGARERRDVDLDPESTITGRVVGADGVPVAGATVTLEGAAEGPEDPADGGRARRRGVRMRSEERRIEGGGHGPREPVAAAGGGERSARTAADGTFQLGGLAAGEFVVSAAHREHAAADPVPVSLARGVPLAGVELRLKAGGILAGRVFDEHGKAMPGAEVQARRKPVEGREEGRGGQATAISDAQGRYEITGLLPGVWLAKAEDAPAGGAKMVIRVDTDREEEDPAETEVLIAAGKTATADLRLPPKGSVAGMVTEGGRPVPGAKVWITGPDSPMPFGAPTMPTDERGAYGFPRVALGTWIVNVTPPGGTLPVAREVEVVAPREFVVDVPLPTGAIEGRVVDEASGKPVAGVTVGVEKSPKPGAPRESRAVMIAVAVDDSGGASTQTISFSTGEAPPVVTDSDGRFAIRYLDAGDYDVGIKGGGVLRERRERVHVAPDDVTRRVDFQAKKGATLAVTVEGAPSFAIVSLFRAGGDEPLDTKAAAAKDPFRFEGLAAGRYRVEVQSPPSDDRTSKEVDVPAAIETSVRCQARN